MLTLKLLRDDPQYVVRKLAIKNFDASEIVGKILELDSRRRALQTESDALLSKQKQAAKAIGAAGDGGHACIRQGRGRTGLGSSHSAMPLTRQASGKTAGDFH